MILKKLFALLIAVLPVIVSMVSDVYEIDFLGIVAIFLLIPSIWAMGIIFS